MSPAVFPTIKRRYEINGRENWDLSPEAFLDKIRTMTQSTDTVILVYHGHGHVNLGIALSRDYRYCSNEMKEKYIFQLLPGSPERLRMEKNFEKYGCDGIEQTVSYDRIAEVLAEKNVFFINMACFAGSAEKQMRPQLGKDFLLFASSPPDEKSFGLKILKSTKRISQGDNYAYQTAHNPVISEVNKRIFFYPDWPKIDRNKDHVLNVGELLADFRNPIHAYDGRCNKALLDRLNPLSAWTKYIPDNGYYEICLKNNMDNREEDNINNIYIRQAGAGSGIPKLIVKFLNIGTE
jgi:hypothetical protein